MERALLSETLRATKNYTSIWGSDENSRDGSFFRDGQHPEAQNFLRII